MTKALYAFSGDPITFGHIDIIKRAATVFSEIIVGIGVNPDKQHTFTLEERTMMAQQCLTGIENVQVVSFTGLLVDYAYEHDISVIIKGVRNQVDFNYESILHQVGERHKLGIDTHILIAKPELSHISSSTVKAIQKEQGSIQEYVPLNVKQCVEKKISNQYILGITGEIGVGKSFISQQFVEMGKKSGINVYDIDLDRIGHQILSNLMESGYQRIRKKIIVEFGEEIVDAKGFIDRKVLGEIVFNDFKRLRKLNKIMLSPIQVRLRRELYGKQGLIILNAALLAEADMTYLCNNNVLIVKVDKEIQKNRLKSRDLDEKQIKRRLESQYSFEKKKKHLELAIQKHNHGKIWILDSTDGSQEAISKSFNQFITYFRIK